MLNDVHTRVDQLVSTIRTQIGLLQEHRQALITAAVTGELEIPGVAA
jgi:type I restriction enzyme S subunit